MKRFIFLILFLFPTLLFSQTIDLRIPTTVGSADSLNNKPASYYVDTATAQNINGDKTFKGNIIIGNNILPDSTGKRSLGSQSFRIKKIWLGNGIDMDGRAISLDGIDNGINFDGRIHIKAENDTSGNICLHASKYMPLVNTESGYRLWADSTTNRPKWLLPNSNINIKVNHTFIMADTSGNVGIGTTNPDAKLDVRGSIIAKEGFATKLWDVSGVNFETAIVNTEYYSPNQQGGIYGTIYRQYFTTTLSSSLTTGNNISRLVDFAIYFNTGSIRGLSRGRTSSGSASVQLELSGTSGNGNLAFANSSWTLIDGWVDYTK